jgi:PAS domain S-box-containing protein
MTPDSREEFASDLPVIMAAKTPFEKSFSIEVEGVKKQIQAQGDFLLDPSGTVTHIIGITRDITQQHEYEQQLAFKEKMLNAVSDAIIATDLNFRITAWNKGAERIYGWTAEETLGQDAAQLLKSIMPEETDYQTALHTVQTAGTLTIRITQLRKDGHRIPVLNVSNKIIDEKNRHIGYLALNRDITDLVRMEEELQYRQNLLNTVMDHSPDSVYLLDPEYKFLQMNATCRQSFLDRFGVSVSEGDLITEKVPPGAKPVMVGMINQALSGKAIALEGSYPDFQGKEQFIEFSLNPVRNGKGEVTAVASYVRNITDRKKLQQQAIEQEVAAQRIKAASLMAGQEQERVRLVSELHDGIGQMLHALKLKIDTLADKIPSQNEEFRILSDLSGQVISEIKRLVQDAIPYDLEHLSLAGAIRNLVARYKGQQNADTQITLWITITQEHFDKTLEMFIYRLVQESLKNAIHYSGARTINVQLSQFTDHLLLMVEDDGAGFVPEEALKQETARSGLNNLVERCSLFGAQIDIDALPEHGCTITIKAPLCT